MLKFTYLYAILMFLQLGLSLSVAASQCSHHLSNKINRSSSNCTENYNQKGQLQSLSCDCQRLSLDVGFFDRRVVKYRIPLGTPPKDGFPVVFLFQGSYFPVEFSRSVNLPFGGFNEIRLIQTLLDSGFAVIAPEARLGLGWETNLPQIRSYELTNDYKMMKSLIDGVNNQIFGPLNGSLMFATGISSGGYQSSRVGIAFPKVFKLIAIHSASYATLLGPVGSVPENLSKDHPPTLLIHGRKDLVVPAYTAEAYAQSLKLNKIHYQLIIEKESGHAWFVDSPQHITNWFLNSIPK